MTDLIKKNTHLESKNGRPNDRKKFEVSEDLNACSRGISLGEWAFPRHFQGGEGGGGGSEKKTLYRKKMLEA